MEHMTNDVELGDKKYYVSTAFTLDHGLETMVFAYDEGGGSIGWICTQKHLLTPQSLPGGIRRS